MKHYLHRLAWLIPAWVLVCLGRDLQHDGGWHVLIGTLLIIVGFEVFVKYRSLSA